tara:strand:- start:362 stop:493 length:132 start_codon:yes stop_codon:yes gene_type:complete
MEWIYVSPLNNPEGIIEGGDILFLSLFLHRRWREKETEREDAE